MILSIKNYILFEKKENSKNFLTENISLLETRIWNDGWPCIMVGPADWQTDD